MTAYPLIEAGGRELIRDGRIAVKKWLDSLSYEEKAALRKEIVEAVRSSRRLQARILETYPELFEDAG